MVILKGILRCAKAASKKIARVSANGDGIMKVLNVAEKNDAAKSIAGLLSGGNLRRREGRSKFNKIYEFDYGINGQRCKMVVTSVSGHLLNYAFTSHYKKWTSCSPLELFDAPVTKICLEDYQAIKTTLEREASNCDILVIWTDCDREGENIGYEIISVCTAVKPTIKVHRARFSEITKQSVKRAFENLDEPNQSISDAVDVRSELDLRIGAAFTRFQTLRLQKVFPEILSNSLISYGSCQFPTLGFVVERYKAVQDFIPEQFWKIKVNHKVEEVNTEFLWKRVKLFDELFCKVLYEKCKENPQAKVELVQTKPKTKWRPTPLDTVELEKSASRKLKINAKETMKIAERLYSKGYISYPRTETNIFPPEINLSALVEMQTEGRRWGEFATKVLQDGANPRQGKKSDQAHPPIHPTKFVDGLQGNDAKVYEYIVRHFLACVSKDAEGLETIVNIDINGEKFTANGLIILALNYLEVFPYEKWNAKEINKYEVGQLFTPTNIDMIDGQTSPPSLLTEADLIALMEKHGIGTDATHAEHIETIKERLYVGLENGIYFVPGELGIGLVEGYDSMGFEMSKPHLRAELEVGLKAICDGTRNPEIVLSEQVAKYKSVFEIAVQQANKIDAALTKYFRSEALPVQNDIQSLVGGDFPTTIMKCPICGADMMFKERQSGLPYVSCSRYPDCRKALWFPSKVLNVEISEDCCDQCQGSVRLLSFRFQPGSMAPFYPNVYKGCIGGCDQQFLQMMDIDLNRNSNAANRLSGLSSQLPNSDNGETFPLRRPDISAGNSSLSRTDNPYSNSSQSIRPNSRQPAMNGFQSRTQVRKNQDSQNQRPVWRQPAINGFQSTTQVLQNQDDENDVHCNCDLPARRFTVMKESVNKGRPFLVCPKPQSDSTRCNFFLWVDSSQPSAPRTPTAARTQNSVRYNNNGHNHRPTQSGRNSTPHNFRAKRVKTVSNRKCGICRQEGHNRNNCPNKDND